LFALEHVRFIGGLRAAPEEGRYGIEPARSLRLRERAEGVAAAIVAADRAHLGLPADSALPRGTPPTTAPSTVKSLFPAPTRADRTVTSGKRSPRCTRRSLLLRARSSHRREEQSPAEGAERA
jgi:hypothetical protein